jgi:hypothetical protein
MTMTSDGAVAGFDDATKKAATPIITTMQIVPYSGSRFMSPPVY